MLTQATPKTKNRRKQTWRLIAQRIFKWKARKIGLLELTFYVFSRILNLQIHAHIYRSFIRHHKMLGVRIAKRKIEPQKPANPCDTRLCSCIFSWMTLPNSNKSMRLVDWVGLFYTLKALVWQEFHELSRWIKYETWKCKLSKSVVENEKIRRFEHGCLI